MGFVYQILSYPRIKTFLNPSLTASSNNKKIIISVPQQISNQKMIFLNTVPSEYRWPENIPLFTMNSYDFLRMIVTSCWILHGFEIKGVFRIDWISPRARESSLCCYLNRIRRRKQWIHDFPKGKCLTIKSAIAGEI